MKFLTSLSWLSKDRSLMLTSAILVLRIPTLSSMWLFFIRISEELWTRLPFTSGATSKIRKSKKKENRKMEKPRKSTKNYNIVGNIVICICSTSDALHHCTSKYSIICIHKIAKFASLFQLLLFDFLIRQATWYNAYPLHLFLYLTV